MEKFDRVVLKEDLYKGNKITLSRGAIGTIREFIDKNVLVQIDFIDGQPKHISVPIEYLRIVSTEDLDSLQSLSDCIKIINKLYHPNNNYVTTDGTIYTIKGIRLSSNELHDEFIVSVQTGNNIESKTINRKFLDNNTSLVAYEYEQNNETNPKEEYSNLNNTGVIEKEELFEEYNINIKIGDYEFISNGKVLRMPTINIKDFNKFNKAYDKLIQFMNER